MLWIEEYRHCKKKKKTKYFTPPSLPSPANTAPSPPPAVFKPKEKPEARSPGDKA